MKSSVELVRHSIRKLASRVGRRRVWRVLQPFRGSAPGEITVEYLILVGLCAFLSIAAFHNYGRTLNEHLDQQAEHIHGRGMPNAEDLLDVGDTGGDSWCPPGLWFCVPMPDLPDVPDLPDGTSGGSTPDLGDDERIGGDEPSDATDDPGGDEPAGDDAPGDDPGDDDPSGDDPGDATSGGDEPSDDEPSDEDPSEDPEDDETEERETDK